MTLDAVVTGASTGIGRSAVKVLVGHGWRVFAGVRKVADAESLRQEFGEAVEPLLFDVTDAAAVRRPRTKRASSSAARPSRAWSTTPASRSADRSRISRSTRFGGCSRSTRSAR